MYRLYGGTADIIRHYSRVSKRAIDYNLIVVLAGDMSQHVLNNLARDVGVLETYGNCDDTRLGELLGSTCIKASH